MSLSDTELAALHKAMSDEVRLDILRRVASHPEGVSFQGLYAKLSAPRGAAGLAEVSVRYHVYQLRGAGLLVERAAGRDRIYKISIPVVARWAATVLNLTLELGVIDDKLAEAWPATFAEDESELPVTLAKEPE
jgi:DNA-binding transcriptional ArsR family regulator